MTTAQCTGDDMFISIGKAADMLGVCPKTLKRWETKGKMSPSFRTPGGHRRYEVSYLKGFVKSKGNQTGNENILLKDVRMRAVCYARVSGNKQKEDLKRQVETLMGFCEKKGYKIVGCFHDIASGLNDGRRGLKRLSDTVFGVGADVVVVTYPDRLARFGTGFIRHCFEGNGTAIESVFGGKKSEKKRDDTAYYNELVEDMVALLTSFAGKLHRMRRGKGRSTGVSDGPSTTCPRN